MINDKVKNRRTALLTVGTTPWLPRRRSSRPSLPGDEKAALRRGKDNQTALHCIRSCTVFCCKALHFFTPVHSLVNAVIATWHRNCNEVCVHCVHLLQFFIIISLRAFLSAFQTAMLLYTNALYRNRLKWEECIFQDEGRVQSVRPTLPGWIGRGWTKDTHPGNDDNLSVFFMFPW